MAGQQPPSDERLVLVRLLGIDQSMALAEAEALGCRILERRGRVILADVATAEPLDRLAYSSMVLEYLGESCDASLPFDPAPILERGSYAVRTDGIHGPLRERVVDAMPLATVDLRSPDSEVWAFGSAEGIWWGRLVWQTGPPEFAPRDASHRPFPRSFLVQPRKARCLVNLSGVRQDELLLDPFCGTGSIPIEASLVGARTYASDADGVMVRGTMLNASSAGATLEARRLDARSLHAWDMTFDAIVTDVPYGRSASLRGSEMTGLYEEFVRSAAGVLRPGGRLVVMSRQDTLPVLDDAFVRVHEFEEYVHGKLTREVVVLKRR